MRRLEDLINLTAFGIFKIRRVVLAHGVFDLIHMGHVRHLEAAKREGDVLIVTVTADKFVNKGPDRPVFPAAMRAEMLAALECVDFVAISESASAIEAINTIKPDVYAKGSDYENASDDVTDSIAQERAAVESYGGRIVFTKGETFSSSALINKHLDVYDPPLRDYLAHARADIGLQPLLDLIESVKNYRVVLIGDTIIDEYNYVRPMGKATKDNIIATQFEKSERFAGGVIATANVVASFCREVEVITQLGLDDLEFVRSHLPANVKLTPLIERAAVRKVRFVEINYMRKLFEVYYCDEQSFARWIPLPGMAAPSLQKADVVIANDFGHGMIINHLQDNAPFLAVNAQTNAGNHGFNLITKYAKADYVCLDAPEARLAVQDRHSDIADVVQDKLADAIDCSKIIITNGPQGCITFERGNGPVTTIPAFTKNVVDTIGAGDAFLAVTAPLVRAGGKMEHVGMIGNAAGALKVGIVGHRQYVEKVPLVKFLTALMK